jgi:putative zinc finger/helix-turn-helix YgiT family protein
MPSDWRPQQVRDPRSRQYFTPNGAWEFITECLEAGQGLEEVLLQKPEGKTGYVMQVDVGSDRPLLYIKLQLGSGAVIGRSFHYSEHMWVVLLMQGREITTMENDGITMAPLELPSVKCPNCGQSNVRTTLENQQFTYGEGAEAAELTARVPVRTCDDCGFQFLDEAGEVAKHEAVCRHLGLMTPAEITSIRKRYGLSRTEFARLTRIGGASLARWENALLIQNAAHDNLLYLLPFMENVERLQWRRHGEPIGFALPAAQASLGHSQNRPAFRALGEISPQLRKEAAAFNPGF